MISLRTDRGVGLGHYGTFHPNLKTGILFIQMNTTPGYPLHIKTIPNPSPACVLPQNVEQASSLSKQAGRLRYADTSAVRPKKPIRRLAFPGFPQPRLSRGFSPGGSLPPCLSQNAQLLDCLHPFPRPRSLSSRHMRMHMAPAMGPFQAMGMQ
jgi:hypothetical protein